MGLLGNISLYVAFASILVTIGAGAFGARSGNRGLVRIAEQTTLVTAAEVSAAVLALQIALVTLDFSLAYVGEYTSSTLSVLYRIGSMWAGQGGSLLLWGWIIALTAAWTVYKQRKSDIGITGWVYAVYGLFAALFIVMTAFLQSPFAAAEGAVADGMGLNPLSLVRSSPARCLVHGFASRRFGRPSAGSCSPSAWCSALVGPTRNSAGVATGHGIRSRTHL